MNSTSLSHVRRLAHNRALLRSTAGENRNYRELKLLLVTSLQFMARVDISSTTLPNWAADSR
jgi:hypothetical protein